MIKAPCSCGADCDYCGQGECDGYVKPVGVHKKSKAGDGWIHSCKAHHDLAKQESGTVWDADWDKPGPM